MEQFENVRDRPIWIVKIGGSLLGSSELERWLTIFAKFSYGNIIIVPGGGVFADAVRDAQKLSKISDACAHRLAVLAMDQYGLLLANMNPLLTTARTHLEIDERRWQHRGIVWLPSHMVLSDDSIPQNWNVTSDSIAAWLAQKLNAQHLILVKSDSQTVSGNIKSELSLKVMTQNGVLDEAFTDFVLNKKFGKWMLHKTDYTHFLEGLSELTLDKVGSSIH